MNRSNTKGISVRRLLIAAVLTSLPCSSALAQQIKLVINTHSHADADTTTIQADLKASRDALVTIRSRVQTLIDEGKSEAEVIAAKPTKDLDARWAPRGGFLSGDVITRMAYQSVKGASAPARR